MNVSLWLFYGRVHNRSLVRLGESRLKVTTNFRKTYNKFLQRKQDHIETFSLPCTLAGQESSLRLESFV